MKIIRGFITFSSETPDAFMAVSSKLSPRLPKVMSDASRMESGRAIGTMVRAA